MRSPFSSIMPPVQFVSILFWRRVLIICLLIIRGRTRQIKKSSYLTLSFFPSWLSLISSKVPLIIGSIIIFMSISLIPLGVICFHFPSLGVGLRMTLWVVIVVSAITGRPVQFKKEYLGDASIRGLWGFVALFIERIRRGARALTLGARIRVNIIIGGILHGVLGERSRRWGIFILCGFEMIVVVVQSYVLILLLWFYRVELE